MEVTLPAGKQSQFPANGKRGHRLCGRPRRVYDGNAFERYFVDNTGLVGVG
jgi:hypothetical protein